MDNPASLAAIELLAREFAAKRTHLQQHVDMLQIEIDTIKRKRLPLIRRAVAAAAEARDHLRAAIERSAHLFVKPRTQTLHGIKVGFMKGKGGLAIADEDKAIEILKRRYPEHVEACVRVKESLVKDALANLPADVLKKIGVEIRDAGDEVFIKPADSEVDKLVDALLKEARDRDMDEFAQPLGGR
jgi:phage host-nuclease inhibitor protein Gam